MRKWYKRNFYFNELNSNLFSTGLFYVIAAGITYFAYTKGVITLIGVDGINLQVDNVILAPVAVFVFLYMFLELISPVFFGICLFIDYYKTFSNTEKIRGIIPISNKNKIISMMKSIVIFYISFLIVTYIANFSMGIRDYNSINTIVLVLSIVFCEIIVDILCRERKLSDMLKIILIIISALILFIGGNLLLVILEEYLRNFVLISSIVLIIFSILEFTYILKKIDSIKIS